jgi:hypothetical protein
VVAQRILNFLKEKKVSSPQGALQLHSSVGFTIVEPNSMMPENIPHPMPSDYFENMGLLALKRGDEALYQIKKEGGGQMREGLTVQWNKF